MQDQNNNEFNNNLQDAQNRINNNISGSSGFNNNIEQKPVKKSKKKLITLIIAGLLLVALVGFAVYFFIIKNDSSQQEPIAMVGVSDSSEEPKGKEEISEELARFINPTTGEEWYAEKRKINDPGIYKPIEYGSRYAGIYEIGMRGENTILMSEIEGLGTSVYLFEKTPAGEMSYIARPDAEATYNEENDKYTVDEFNSSVKIDKNTHYDSLTLPFELKVTDNYTAKKPVYATVGSPISKETQQTNNETAKRTAIKELGGSTLLKIERSYSDTNITAVDYLVETPIKTSIGLDFEPIPTSLDGYRWSVGVHSNDNISSILRGCGSGGGSIARADLLSESDLTEVGKTSDNQTVYHLNSTSHDLFTKAYDEFKTSVNYPESDNRFKDITKQEFSDNHGIVIFIDKDNQLLAYTRDELAPDVGCAKPVVYLYPEQRTLVNVRVGADVKISEPLYDNATGWQNVLASPSGALVYNGNRYDSLFWEGPGIGKYPGINSGVIVKSYKALDTIKFQLQQQGFNNEEIDDFVEYWTDKLPNKPYTRLTWLTTEQMNELAPLYISPKPHTVIRTFLDFQGLDEPYLLSPQTFSSPIRAGFTVTEWGGLSPYKLY